MGAHDYEGYGFGKSMSEAWDRLVEQEQYEYGHEPYSGTFASKGGGVVDLDRVFDDGVKRSMKRKFSIVQDALGTYEVDVRDGWFEKPKRGSYDKLVTVTVKDGWTARTASVLMPRKVQKADEALVARIATMIGDKWGPAGGIEITGSKAAELKKRQFGWNGSRAPRGTKVYFFVGIVPS
jgi:hypothetical protein